mgnify:CR=1 FL=1
MCAASVLKLLDLKNHDDRLGQFGETIKKIILNFILLYLRVTIKLTGDEQKYEISGYRHPNLLILSKLSQLCGPVTFLIFVG